MLHWPPSTITVFIITIVILKSSASSDKPSSLLCPPDWIYINITDKYIKGGQISGSYDENLKYCNGLNASMITIESSEENDEIFKQFASLNIFRFWIAGKTEGILLNEIHQTKIDLMKSTYFSNWGQGSPNCPIGEECCIMVDSQKQWHNYVCSNDLYFACEKRRIFESSELNQSVSANPSPEEMECSGRVGMTAPLEDGTAKVKNENQVNHIIFETTPVSSSSKPETPSLEPRSTKLDTSWPMLQTPPPPTFRPAPSYATKPNLTINGITTNFTVNSITTLLYYSIISTVTRFNTFN
uniref:C-type lectin domain-containing protein n=1 Tax=Tetranychus urticae TaxID=32264 RepID=T1KQ84_TETUR